MSLGAHSQENRSHVPLSADGQNGPVGITCFAITPSVLEAMIISDRK